MKLTPLVQDNGAIPDLNVIAYLGIPITSPDGTALGALCAIESKPRKWTDHDVSMLTDLAAAVSVQIGLRATMLELDKSRLDASYFGEIVENSHHEVFTFDPETLLFANGNMGARNNLGYSVPVTPMVSCLGWIYLTITIG